MENQLEIIKSHLPGGYEKKIAEEDGCCRQVSTGKFKGNAGYC